MAKRGRKPKNPTIFESVDPKVAKEVTGVILATIAVILILSMFGGAGAFGRSFFAMIRNTLGIVAYIFSIFLVFLSIHLINQDLLSRGKYILWGLLIFMMFFAGFVAPFGDSGGVIGMAIFSAFSNLLGDIATEIILFAFSVITLALAFNFSIVDAVKKVDIGSYGSSDLKREGKVPLFRAVRRRIGMGGRENKPELTTAPVITTPDGAWKFPDVELLEESTGKAQPGNVSKNLDILTKTLSDFGVEVSGGSVNVGPTVTQYELKPAEGVKLNNIKARADDLALALAAHPVRVEAPIPGKAAVGVEVPNKQVEKVTLRQVLGGEAFAKRTSNLSIALGLDVAGKSIIADLRSMPHLLVAGSTGSGKSVGLNTIILSLLYQNSPRDLRILLVDPKRVEFTMYNGIPHLFTPVVCEVDKTINLLRWAISEMERRFKLFEKVGSRDITSYNEKVGKGYSDHDGTSHQKLPFIVIVIDELADLMAQASNEVEAAIVRLAQLARATGMHLVVATQRPSVDVITGLIKANITARIAFAVASQIDSRTIIDQSGAEKLLGNGDLLFLGGEFSKPKRIQGAFASEKDVKSVTDFLKSEGTAIYDNSITEYRDVAGIKSSRRGGGGLDGGASDELLEEAKRLVVESNIASASFLQRRMQVGYARAARLLDLMQAEGIIGPAKGAKPRDILVDTVDSFDETDEGSHRSF